MPLPREDLSADGRGRRLGSFIAPMETVRLRA
jgi:hypothetical protein